MLNSVLPYFYGMNIIKKFPLQEIGIGFIEQKYLPEGENEYYLRNRQNRTGVNYRNLTAYEIEVLIRNRNTAGNWNDIFVAENFNPELVKNCKFFGLIRIGSLEPVCLEFNNLRLPVGLYNSTIINCDFGNNVVIDNVNYMAYYVVGNEVMIVNVNELVTTSHAKFGNGNIKEGEEEKNRIWMEVCNENGGRKILPFNGMLPGDAYLFSRRKDNAVLHEKFKKFTDVLMDTKRGYYGKIGDRTIIKNSKIIKDTWIGTDAYIKGANKIKNITINSSDKEKSQVGEGCELVNGIVGYGCRVFYGVKAVRFVMSSNSQLKYGARLLNSYLGDNSTISCCEVLNALIFPSHEQHHNNSFLVAGLIMGQCNMAAGATIGSNHNSRSADGEIIAGRGFWPGLCVSLKHNSIFASFTIIAKGDYNYEINNPIPFALLSVDTAKDCIYIMPAYWFMYNMYALSRNYWKYKQRDKRRDPKQLIEYNFLAPDTINEVNAALKILHLAVGKAYKATHKHALLTDEPEIIGERLLETNDAVVDTLEITLDGVAHSKRKVVVLKAQKAYNIYKEVIELYVVEQFVALVSSGVHTIHDLLPYLDCNEVAIFENIGGQLIPSKSVELLLADIIAGKIHSWDDVHNFYVTSAAQYGLDKLKHSIATLKTMKGLEEFTIPQLIQVLKNGISIKTWMVKGIEDSRAKDFTNSYRKMVYQNTTEMYTVLGDPKKNEFILNEIEQLKIFTTHVETIVRDLV
jgi:hypothetical protein